MRSLILEIKANIQIYLTKYNVSEEKMKSILRFELKKEGSDRDQRYTSGKVNYLHLDRFTSLVNYRILHRSYKLHGL